MPACVMVSGEYLDIAVLGLELGAPCVACYGAVIAEIS